MFNERGYEAMKLVIFDLDQTLVDFLSVHDAAVHELLKREFNIDASLKEIDFSGRGMMENIVELVRLKGVPDREISEHVRGPGEYEAIFFQLMPSDAGRHVLPGARELLDRLAMTGHIIALYTGDSRAIGKAVLSATGLDEYFMLSVFGTESPSRLEMARLAVKKARAMTGIDFKGKNVVVIGDSTRDVDCAKQLNALSIAVATGFHTVQELEAHKPDYLFDDLTHTAELVRAIDGSSVEIQLHS